MSFLWQHNSQIHKFRNPFGAVEGGTLVRLSLFCEIANKSSANALGSEQPNVKLFFWTGIYEFIQTEISPYQIDATAEGGYAYHFSLPTPNEGALVFYYFTINDGEAFVLRDDGKDDGSAILWHDSPQIDPTKFKTGGAYSITVSEPGFVTPEWAKGAVVEQIFPDRLRRDRMAKWPPHTCRDSERIYHEQWSDEVDIEGKPETGYLACDFFGGTLHGIMEMLPTYASNGIEAIYLNPIFEARSNHRYDTGNYEVVDPLLGTNQDFAELVAEAKTLGINIILDGVFSHTGSDSKYFNRQERYDEIGAWQNATSDGVSPYASWFSLDNSTTPPSYDAWWGFPDLPNVNELAPMFREYILGHEGIVPTWLECGAMGWRLDVSDELPDAFLRSLRKSAKSVNSSAYILGEVWEDASRQVSFGSYRDFLLGRTHDGVMNYPFRQAVFSWLLHQTSTTSLKNELMKLVENYPLQSLYCNLNLIGSHDTARAVSVLSGVSEPTSRREQLEHRLKEHQAALGKQRLVLARLLQCAFPGMLGVYYGDEYGAEGWRDPCNRKPFEHQRMSEPLAQITATITRMRQNTPVLKTGYFELEVADTDVVMIRRFLAENKTDAFGKTQAGPCNVEFWLNRSAQSVELNGIVSLAAYSYLVLIDGNATELNQS